MHNDYIINILFIQLHLFYLSYYNINVSKYENNYLKYY